MPTSITHQLLAEEVYKSLPEELYKNVSSLAHYYLGAQGADICFTCPPFDKKSNLGQAMHNRSSLLFFRILKQESKKDPLVRSYAYGYITHYAADTVFHPFVYRAMGGKGRTSLHHSIEHAYDGELLRKYRGKGLSGYRLPALSSALTDGVYEAYRRFALACGYGELTRREFVMGGKTYLAAVSFRLPGYKRERAKRAEELFEKSKERSVRLLTAFEKGRIEERNFGLRLSDGQEKPSGEIGAFYGITQGKAVREEKN